MILFYKPRRSFYKCISGSIESAPTAKIDFCDEFFNLATDVGGVNDARPAQTCENFGRKFTLK